MQARLNSWAKNRESAVQAHRARCTHESFLYVTPSPSSTMMMMIRFDECYTCGANVLQRELRPMRHSLQSSLVNRICGCRMCSKQEISVLFFLLYLVRFWKERKKKRNYNLKREKTKLRIIVILLAHAIFAMSIHSVCIERFEQFYIVCRHKCGELDEYGFIWNLRQSR